MRRDIGGCEWAACRVETDGVVVETSDAHEIAPLKEGDGLVFDAADWRSPEEPEEGGRVYRGSARSRWKIGIAFRQSAPFGSIAFASAIWSGGRAIPTSREPPGHLHDASAPVRRQTVRVRITAYEGLSLRAEWCLDARPELSVVVNSVAPLRPARNRRISLDIAPGAIRAVGRHGLYSRSTFRSIWKVRRSPPCRR